MASSCRVRSRRRRRDEPRQHGDLDDDQEGVDRRRLEMPSVSTTVTAAIASAATRLHRRSCPGPTGRPDQRRGETAGTTIPTSRIRLVRYSRTRPPASRRPAVLEHQDPAEAPGEDFAQRGIAVAVGGTGHRHRGRELRVAERRQRAGGSRKHERDHDGRAREVRGGRAGEHVDPGAQDAADAEQHEVQRAECAPKSLLRGICLQGLDRLAREEARGIDAPVGMRLGPALG